MLEIMEIAEKFYKGGTTSKTIHQSDDNCSCNRRNQKEGESASLSNPEKARAGKRKKIYAGDWKNQTTRGKKC